MPRLLIVYHTQSGSCAALAQAACEGASAEKGVSVSLQRACDAGIADVAGSDALLLVAAENSGALSGGAKDFLDRIFYPAIARELVLPYALMISAGNDGRGAVRQAERIFSGIPFTAATAATILRGEVDAGGRDTARELGQALAAGIEMGIF